MNNPLLTENIFPLPGGVMLERDRVLKKATLRPLSGREEEWLARHAGMCSATRVSWLLNACVLSLDDHAVTDELVRQLLIADRDYLILQLRRLTLGENIQAVIACPACNSKMDVNFPVSDVPVEVRPQASSSYKLQLQDRTVFFRLPTGGDQEAVVETETHDPVAQLMKRCILDDGGRRMSSDEKESLISLMEQLAPHLELELDLRCPECAHHFVAPFDTTAFFLEEIALKAEDLLQEVHTLAFYYHWSETEILGLERSRRRTYLGLLNDSLRGKTDTA